jgi:hypothetical protein
MENAEVEDQQEPDHTDPTYGIGVLCWDHSGSSSMLTAASQKARTTTPSTAR